MDKPDFQLLEMETGFMRNILYPTPDNAIQANQANVHDSGMSEPFTATSFYYMYFL